MMMMMNYGYSNAEPTVFVNTNFTINDGNTSSGQLYKSMKTMKPFINADNLVIQH
uniref:Uncharacterized protein n=1 Tax=Octopus bimaculoides TaxID=37653 RepID=A0A0L8HMF5_OCTBM